MTSDSVLLREKAAQIPGILDEEGIDCWLVWVRETSQMADPILPLVLGADLVWISALLFTNEGERLAVVGNYDAAVVPEGLFDRVIPYTEGISDLLRRELERIDPRRIAIDESRDDVAADGLTAGMKLLLLHHLEGTPYSGRLVSAERIIGKLRGRKSPTEVGRIERAVHITDEILTELVNELRVGETEIEIQRRVHARMQELGVGHAWQAASDPAVDAGPEKPFGHGAPSALKTRRGHLLHFDFGVRYGGYCADLQRMAFFGEREEIPEEIARAFDAVRDTIRAAASALRPGVRGCDVDEVARDFIQERGYPPYAHALGHQVGRHAHDGGTLLGPQWERYGAAPLGIVEEGNVFTLELGVPTEQYGSVSLEEDVLVTGDGCRFLSTPQDELLCVPA
ncbi:MAG: aminopeptidase P family protein [Candidatus Bipolaricaulota bacterium]|nr:MAG: aminopeptidase P family protein [Candidatus Bipolaricaulota bacterium]